MRVYVNAAPVDVPAGASALDCVRAWQEHEAAAVESGRRTITDSRGLPTNAVSPAYAGAIYRTVSGRSAAAHE